MAPWSRKTLNKISIFAFFEKRPLRENFRNSVPKEFIATPIEIGNVVHYLPDKKKSKFRLALQLSLLRGSRPGSVLRVLQISSKSVHCRRNYIWTREHCQSALESESNIRLKPIFQPINKTLKRHTHQVQCNLNNLPFNFFVSNFAHFLGIFSFLQRPSASRFIVLNTKHIQ